MRGRTSSVGVALGIAAGWLFLVTVPASAACHIAAFVEPEVEAEESVGVVSLVVELQGGVGSCAGTVDVASVDGTAIAGEDYEAVDQTLTFEENDDRVETVDVTILADGQDDGGEAFTLELSNPTGSISGTGGPATVTIVDAAAAGDADAGEATEATDTPTVGATPVDGADDLDEGDGLQLGIVLAVVAAVAVGIAAFVLLRGRDG